MKILIISQCTGKKACGKNYPGQLVLADFRQGPAHVAARKAGLPAAEHRSAGTMYVGPEHILLMRGIHVARAAGIDIELWILSAGYGLISEHRIIVPYDATFNGMPMAVLDAWALALGAPAAFQNLVHGAFDFGMVLLGDRYLRACAIGGHTGFGGRSLLLGTAARIRPLIGLPNLRCRKAGPDEAHLLGGAGSMAIKGEIARLFLEKLAHSTAAGRIGLVNQIMNPAIDPLSLIP